jgi:hypothetical protein
MERIRFCILVLFAPEGQIILLANRKDIQLLDAGAVGRKGNVSSRVLLPVSPSSGS